MIRSLLLLLASALYCVAAPVQSCVNSASATSVSCSLGSSVASGDLLVVVTKTSYSSSAGTLTVSSTTGSCTWSKIGSVLNQTTSNYAAQMGWCIAPSTGSQTVQASWSTGGGFADISVSEYHSASGWNVSPVDVTATATGSSTVCASGTTSATTYANELAVGVCMAWNNAQTWAGTAGSYTNESSASRNTLGWYDLSLSSAGTQSFSDTLSSSDTWAALYVTFKQAVATAKTFGWIEID